MKNVVGVNSKKGTAEIACAYRTIVELTEYYCHMDEMDEWERLKAMKNWLRTGLVHLAGKQQVMAWEKKAKSPNYSPFAARK